MDVRAVKLWLGGFVTALIVNDNVGGQDRVGIEPSSIAETVILSLCLGGLKELFFKGESKELISISSDYGNKCKGIKQRGRHWGYKRMNVYGLDLAMALLQVSA